MKPSKQQYLESIRDRSAYPVYRGIISTIALISYLIALFWAIGGLVAALVAMARSFLAGLGLLLLGAMLAALNYFLARFFKEGALIVADIGDSIVEANSRVLAE